MPSSFNAGNSGFHPADLPRLVVTDPNKVHVVAAQTYEPRRWQWRLHIPKQAKLRLFIASEEIPAEGFPAKYRVSDLPNRKIPLRAKIRQGRFGQWKISAVYPSGLLGREIPEDHCAWIAEPDSFCETQAGMQGTELADINEPVVLLRLRAMRRDGNTEQPSDGVMIWIAEGHLNP